MMRTKRAPIASPAFRRQLDALVDVVDLALSRTQIRDAILKIGVLTRLRGGLIHDSSDEPIVRPEILEQLEEITRVVEAEHPELLDYIGKDGLTNLVLSRIAGRPLRQLTFRQLPGIQSPNPYFVADEQDVEWLKAKIRPGQVWINATELDVDSYRALWGAVSFQIQAGAEKAHMPSGRPKGRASVDRQAFKKQLAEHSQWTSKEIYEAAVASGIWPADGSYYDFPERNKARVRRLRNSPK